MVGPEFPSAPLLLVGTFLLRMTLVLLVKGEHDTRSSTLLSVNTDFSLQDTSECLPKITSSKLPKARKAPKSANVPRDLPTLTAYRHDPSEVTLGHKEPRSLCCQDTKPFLVGASQYTQCLWDTGQGIILEDYGGGSSFFPLGPQE